MVGFILCSAKDPCRPCVDSGYSEYWWPSRERGDPVTCLKLFINTFYLPFIPSLTAFSSRAGNFIVWKRMMEGKQEGVAFVLLLVVTLCAIASSSAFQGSPFLKQGVCGNTSCVRTQTCC